MPFLTAAFVLLSLAVGSTQTTSVASTADVYGRALDSATFAPVAGARVFLYPIPFPPGHKPRASISDRNGEYSFIGIPEGFYRLGLYHDEYFPTADMSETSVRLRPGERRNAMDLMMTQGGALNGRVLGPSGAPLRNVLVSAVQPRGPRFRQARPDVHTARTNARGEFRLAGLRPGQWVVVAHHQQGQNDLADEVVTESLTYYPGTLELTAAREVSVQSARTTSGLEFTLQSAPTFAVAGAVVDRKGEPVRGATVEIYGNWPLFGGLEGWAHTDEHGQFQIGSLIPEDYKVYVTVPGIKPSPPTMQTPFVPVTIGDADVRDLSIPLQIR
jgi:protocatechuate 3,4-dioxygenase beta subunit